MLLSDTAIKRPVFATVISLLLVAFGLLAFERLPLREYPDIDPPIVSIRTVYVGASAEVVESRVTQIIEERIAGIEGIKTIDSSSRDGFSSINIEFKLTRDIDAAANDVRDRVSGALADLPEEADPPEVQKTDADEQVIMWHNLTSDEMSIVALVDYAQRYIVDRFAVIDGVARVRISGGPEYAMRIWLDRESLAARQLTVGDIENALRRENVELPAGTLKSLDRDFVVKINRHFLSPTDFEGLVVKRDERGYLTRLGDVARVELGADEHRKAFNGNGVPMVGVGIVKQSVSNTLAVAEAVRVEAEKIRKTLPDNINLHSSYDSSVFIDRAISEVYSTLFIAASLVVLVIFLFLGDFRAMLVPAITVPVSLIATFTVLYALGYTVNLLTLLALVLAIGLVVDDSIVVLENVHRRLLNGEPPLVAAYRGSRQVGFAVIATTAVLVAVFVPISFLEGDVGRLFGEFAVAMAVAVMFSSIVALTLSPVICSKVLNREAMHGGLASFVEKLLHRMENHYGHVLARSMKHPFIAALALVLTIGSCVFFLQKVPAEFAPKEDRGVVFMIIRGPEGASFNYVKRHLAEIEQRLMPMVDNGTINRLLLRAPGGRGGADVFNEATGILVLTPWGERQPIAEVVGEIRKRLAGFTGLSVYPITPQSLGGGFTKPLAFVIGGSNYEELAQWSELLINEAKNNPGLLGIDSDFRQTKPQLAVTINRDRAATLGVDASEINRSLETLLGSRRVTTFMMAGEEYDVIVEGEPDTQRSPEDLSNIYVRSATTDSLIPLGNLVTLQERGDAAVLNRYNRVRAITIDANLADGYSLGDALSYFENLVAEKVPAATIDYKGESLDYHESGNSVYFTFALALLVVYLVLAAQFENFIHPFIILLSVPLAIAGALIGLYFTGQSLNIYSQIALIMLVGLAAKNGILLVEFANQLRDQGLEFDEAILQSARQRLRPIAMTAITTIMGAVPLVLSSGPGSESRYVIGIVVVFGVSSATVLTLLVIPMAYRLLAGNSKSPQTVTRLLEAQLAENEDKEKYS
ncbi:efflux RND transporter permease subunit [Zhongshania aquimaris]|uniref:Efflux RND transporter permease subunit n=1 Tax=Zhongshania aquimaris TaxID=2857107 RepID=A0ABS6VU26_9GAMM|nr:efflux RND transporter permease subunit [Zhongshania aquimaris]MBW2941245.1 efflux RND transporter permease subunit [Zhongshania aquimaris]